MRLAMVVLAVLAPLLGATAAQADYGPVGVAATRFRLQNWNPAYGDGNHGPCLDAKGYNYRLGVHGCNNSAYQVWAWNPFPFLYNVGMDRCLGYYTDFAWQPVQSDGRCPDDFRRTRWPTRANPAYRGWRLLYHEVEKKCLARLFEGATNPVYLESCGWSDDSQRWRGIGLG